MAEDQAWDEQDDLGGHSADPEEFFASLVNEGKGWWEAQKRHALLSTYEKLGNAAGHLLGVALVAIAVVMLVVFASLALAIWLGGLMGSMALGFVVVAGIYLLLLLILHFVLRTALREAITLKVINLLYGDEE